MELGHKGIGVRLPLILWFLPRRTYDDSWWAKGTINFYTFKMELPGFDRIIKTEHE